MRLKARDKTTADDTSIVVFETTLELIQEISVTIRKASPVHTQYFENFVMDVIRIVINDSLQLASKDQSSRFFMKLHMLSCTIMG